MVRIAVSPEAFPPAFEAAFARLRVCAGEACSGQAAWRQQVAAAVRAGFDFAALEPAVADLLTNQALARGADGIEHYSRLLAYVAEGLERGREELPDSGAPPQIMEKALAGGLLSLVAERVARDRVADLPDLVPEAIQFVLTPYLGAEEARRVASSQVGRSGPEPGR